jgi:predicted RecA/RadA family phage recombinase
MATNYVQEGEVLALTAPYNRSAGQGALVGSLFGVALVDVSSGSSASFSMCGVWTLTKTEAQEWATVGLPIYWDDSGKALTTSSGGNTLVGYNTAVAANPSTTGTIRLIGNC